MLDKLNIFTHKYIDAQLSVFEQKEIQKLFKKDIFKVVTPDKVITPKKVPNSIQIFNSSLVNNIKNPYIDQVYKKYYLVVHSHNNEKKKLHIDLFIKNTRY